MLNSTKYQPVIAEKSLKRYTTQRFYTVDSSHFLSPGDLVNNRFRIQRILPARSEISLYIVQDLSNSTRCGLCGYEANHPTQYCDECGFHTPDSSFLLIEGHKKHKTGFAPLINKKLKHRGVLSIFEDFILENNYYLVAQYLENDSLATYQTTINTQKLVHWLYETADALHYLHHHLIFNFGLGLEDIAIISDHPCIFNFVNSVTPRKQELNRYTLADLRNFASSFLTLLDSKQDRLSKLLNAVLIKGINQGYMNSRELLRDISQIKNEAERAEPASDHHKTIILAEKGVSISVGKASDIGIVRSLNEDSIVSFELTNILQSISTPFGFYMVADGMGGYEAGEEASKLAVELIARKIIHSFYGNSRFASEKARLILEDAVFSTNCEIYKSARLLHNQMGTTVTLALLIHLEAFIINIGDARTYHLRQGKLEPITQDHSLVYRLYKMGQLSYEQIPHHPNSNQILCALGEENLKQTLNNLSDHGDHPYFFNIRLERGDGLFLCSDGLWQMIPDKEIEQILNQHHDPQHSVDELVATANRNGGDDNISAIFVKTQ